MMPFLGKPDPFAQPGGMSGIYNAAMGAMPGQFSQQQQMQAPQMPQGFPPQQMPGQGYPSGQFPGGGLQGPRPGMFGGQWQERMRGMAPQQQHGFSGFGQGPGENGFGGRMSIFGQSAR